MGKRGYEYFPSTKDVNILVQCAYHNGIACGEHVSEARTSKVESHGDDGGDDNIVESASAMFWTLF